MRFAFKKVTAINPASEVIELRPFNQMEADWIQAFRDKLNDAYIDGKEPVVKVEVVDDTLYIHINDIDPIMEGAA